MKKLVYLLCLLALPMLMPSCADDDDERFRYRDSIVLHDSVVVRDSIVFYDSVVVRDSVIYRTLSYAMDRQFRSYLLQRYDRNGDDSLSEDELSAVEVIDFSKEPEADVREITSLSGIQQCVNLRTLRVRNHPLSMDGLDLADLSSLKEVDLSGCRRIGSIRLRNDALDKFCCDSVGLQELVIDGAPKLRVLHCSKNGLRAVNLAGLDNLRELFCDHNELQELQLHQHLCALDCSYNRMTELDISEWGLEVEAGEDDYVKDSVYLKGSYYSPATDVLSKPPSIIQILYKGGYYTYVTLRLSYLTLYEQKIALPEILMFDSTAIVDDVRKSKKHIHAGGISDHPPLAFSYQNKRYPYLRYGNQENQLTLYMSEQWNYAILFHWRTREDHSRWWDSGNDLIFAYFDLQGGTSRGADYIYNYRYRYVFDPKTIVRYK